MQIGRYPYYVWLDPYCVVAWISLGIYPGVIYQVNMIVLIWDTSILISIEIKLSYISTRNVQGFLFLYILTKFLFCLVFFVFLMISILMRVKWKLNVTFIKFIFYYFPMEARDIRSPGARVTGNCELMWVQGTKLRSSARPVRALYNWASSPAPQCILHLYFSGG